MLTVIRGFHRLFPYFINLWLLPNVCYVPQSLTFINFVQFLCTFEADILYDYCYNVSVNIAVVVGCAFHQGYDSSVPWSHLPSPHTFSENCFAVNNIILRNHMLV